MADAEDEKDQQVFMGLVSMLSEQVMFALGKLAPPDGGEPQVHLPAAQALIEVLDVIKKRTAGNLADREEKWLEVQLTNLRLNYLETRKSEQSDGEDSEEDEDEDGSLEPDSEPPRDET